MRGPDPRPQPSGSRSATAGVSQGRVALRSQASEGARNGRRQIEQAVLALGREWTRVELEKRRQKECAARARVSATTGPERRRVRRRPMALDCQAQEWRKGLRHPLRHGKESVVVRRLEEWLESKATRSEPTNELIYREGNYCQEPRDPLHDRQMDKAGAPLGSGAVESRGKQRQRRQRGGDQFWGRPGLTHRLRLRVLVKNQDAPLLWN